MLRLEAQELRAEHRDERKRTDSRHDHDDADDPSELLEHETCHTLDHGQREEHGKHCQCRRDYRDTHLLGRMHRRLLWLRTSLQMCRDVLQHHDGVVHDHTDGDRESRHRHDVEGVACSPQIHQRCKEGDRNRKHDDEGRTPSSEEEVNDEHHDEEGHEDGLLQ